MVNGFDYIVIGAGSAGCVLAARLSETADCSVGLLEAGGDPDPRLAPVPGAASHMQQTRADWAFTTTPQKELFDRRIAYPRSRVVGGSSILNYMVYARGNAGDYDGWAQRGNPGWSYADVLPYFRKAESNAEFDDAYHGRNGPLSVETNAHRHPLGDLFVEAAMAMGVPFNPDFNGAAQAGCGYYQATQRGGRRCDTATAYLAPALERPNLTVIKNALVTRIVVEKGRAVAVEHLVDGRRAETLRADREIVLAAGAGGSPPIKMLSGLGPAGHLAECGVPVVADMPGVGRNLEDHLGTGWLTVEVRDPDAFYGRVPARFDEALRKFETTGGGILATHHLDAGAFYSVDPGTAYPQCQNFIIPAISEFGRTDGATDRSRVMLGGWPCRSKSRGSVTLASANPLDPPVIDPNYLTDPDDLRLSIEMNKWSRELLNSKTFEPIRRGLAQPEFESDSEIAEHVRRNASTIWHPTSTCRMGPDGDAVVGADLRVHGLEGLSICDASVMPTMVSGNTNAPTIMIAEKGADLIKQRA